MFYSDNFTFNNISSKDYNIYLVSQDGGILNEHGLPFDINNDDTNITLEFCYADENGVPLTWDSKTITTFLEWVITDDYCEFISDDNKDVVYFLKGIEYSKNFTSDLKGIIEVTFKSISQFAYKHVIKEIELGESSFSIYNYSNCDNNYKPVITLGDISSDYIIITNNTTGKTPLEIYDLRDISNICIDSKMGTILDSKKNNLITNSNRSWIELSKGTNDFSVEGSCSLIIESYYPIMV